MVHPLIDKDIELIKKQSRLQEKISEMKIEIEVIKRAKLDVESQKKEINRAFHELKHELIKLNPRERFLNA